MISLAYKSCEVAGGRQVSVTSLNISHRCRKFPAVFSLWMNDSFVLATLQCVWSITRRWSNNAWSRFQPNHLVMCLRCVCNISSVKCNYNSIHGRKTRPKSNAARGIIKFESIIQCWLEIKISTHVIFAHKLLNNHPTTPLKCFDLINILRNHLSLD